MHYSFGGSFQASFGLEVAFWMEPPRKIELADGILYSVDVGLEYSLANKLLLYTEGQLNHVDIPGLGLSAGPCWQFEQGKNAKIGFQGSGWWIFIVGADCRFRYLPDPTNATNEFSVSPGGHLKFPVWKN